MLQLKEPLNVDLLDKNLLQIKFERFWNWLFEPHTLTVLMISFIVLLYYAFNQDLSSDVHTSLNVKTGLCAAIAVFLLYCAIQLEDSYFVRPHRVVWRIVQGMAIVYLLFLVFILFQTPEFTRNLFTYLDPKLGVPLPEKSYAEDCRLYTPENNESSFFNLKHAIWDPFTASHFIGWFGKSLIYRDFYLSWFMSIWFEVLEKSLKHVLPNFEECWWDHLILDILVCNGLGIWIGHKLLNYFEAKKFNWMGINHTPITQIQTTSGKIKRIFLQFTPLGWKKFEWDFLSSPRRFLGTIFLVIWGSVIELNCFFLKFVLWHPPPHYVVVNRLWLWFFIALPATREWYEFVNNPNCKKIGTMAWLALTITGVEILIWVKCSVGQFPHVKSHPPVIVALWTIGIISLIAFYILHFYVFKSHLKKDDDSHEKKE